MKRILITGASSGIGMYLANGYLAAGWHVIACGRSLSKLEGAISSVHPQLTLCTFDINSQSEVLEALKPFTSLNSVILNAGTCEYMDEPLLFDSSLFKRVIETNVIGTGYCLEGVIGNIKQGGQLAIVSSSVTLLPLTRSEAYGASKAALDYLTRTLAIDLSPKGIAVSLIRPGFVDTAMTAGYGAKLTPEEGTVAIRHCLFKDLSGNGWYYGSDAVRSPLHFMRNPGEPEYDGINPFL